MRNTIYFDNKTIKTEHPLNYINGIAHIPCSYLKKLLPITDFQLRFYPEKNSYVCQQPSRLGQKVRDWDKGKSTPRISIDKLIDGIPHRRCNELKIFLPLKDFALRCRGGKMKYRCVSKQGKKIENLRNIQSLRKAIARWKLNNKHKLNFYSSKRRCLKKKAYPQWLNNLDIQHIKDIYKKRTLLETTTGLKYDVHHIYPIIGKGPGLKEQISCGLHVPWNLLILPSKINSQLNCLNLEFTKDKLKVFKDIQTEYTKTELAWLFS